MKAKRGALKGATSPDGMACRKALQPIIRFRASCARRVRIRPRLFRVLPYAKPSPALIPRASKAASQARAFPKPDTGTDGQQTNLDEDAKDDFSGGSKDTEETRWQLQRLHMLQPKQGQPRLPRPA